MKSYFQKCSNCGGEVMLSEMQNGGVTTVLCRDSLACDRQKRQNDQAHLDALLARQQAIEAERREIIEGIAAWYKRTGKPNPIDTRHFEEVAKINAE